MTAGYQVFISYKHTDEMIIAPTKPARNQNYRVRAARTGGQWTLFVNEEAVGNYPDRVGNTQFQQIVLVTVGSVAVDDIEILSGP